MRIPLRCYLCALLSALAPIALAVLGSASITHAETVTRAYSAPRAVALTDARRAPDFLRLVRPGASVTPRYRGSFSDVSAYRWNGRALSAQRWDAREHMHYWQASNGTRVGFDGTFYNGTRSAVIVAAWKG